MAKTNAMRCPRCGIEMNYHAEKIDYITALTEPNAIDPDLGGIVEEVHTCPGCGDIGTRRAAQEEDKTA
jgi:predicted RNA-binding Zn-ribbon protein involved in translation (DUF1610 family)